MKNMKIRDTKKRTENKRIREGDYVKPGVTIQGEWTTFTFDAEKEDSCFVVLKDMQTEKEEKIRKAQELAKNAKPGSLTSKANLVNKYNSGVKTEEVIPEKQDNKKKK